MTDRAAECLAKLGLEHPAESEQAHAPTQVHFCVFTLIFDDFDRIIPVRRYSVLFILLVGILYLF